MKGAEKLFPCPSCGFEVFSEPAGSYEICALCGWEDDHVQLSFPALAGGANKSSLSQHQLLALANYPATVAVANGYRRAKGWRPLIACEVASPESPASGLEYFNAASEEIPPYYWQRHAPR